jgi:hypothetical protein
MAHVSSPERESTSSYQAGPGNGPRRYRPGAGIFGWVVPLMAIVLVSVFALAVLHRNPWPPFGRTTVKTDPPVLGTIKDMHEYRGASGIFQVVVNSDNDFPVLPRWLKGEHVTFLAQGSVDAAVDFSGLKDDAVKVDDKSVTIRLPHAALQKVQFDETKSRVLDRDRGFWDRIDDAIRENPDNPAVFYAAAKPKIQEAATQTKILATAEENTAKMLTGFLGALGFETVTVDWEKNPA